MKMLGKASWRRTTQAEYRNILKSNKEFKFSYQDDKLVNEIPVIVLKE